MSYSVYRLHLNSIQIAFYTGRKCCIIDKTSGEMSVLPSHKDKLVQNLQQWNEMHCWLLRMAHHPSLSLLIVIRIICYSQVAIHTCLIPRFMDRIKNIQARRCRIEGGGIGNASKIFIWWSGITCSHGIRHEWMFNECKELISIIPAVHCLCISATEY